ncbi:MAG: adenylate kinase [Elusimicrobia bacterium]|nr:adenylate kinase [Elusimicrobiota bacterium]
MNIILLGYPGSGKGTQAQALSAQLKMSHISTGDLFREEIAKGTLLGQRVSEYLTGGKLVDDKTVLEVINSKFEEAEKAKESEKNEEAVNGFLFDGFPRTVQQAESLDALLASKKMELDAVIFLNVDEADVVERISSRRICAKCSKVYNVISSPPQKENVCDECEGELIFREDDKPAVMQKRMMVYKYLTEPLISYYHANGVFYEIQARGDVQAITGNIISLIKTEITKNEPLAH